MVNTGKSKAAEILRFNVLVQSPFPFRLNRMDTIAVSKDKIVIRSNYDASEIVFDRDEIGNMHKPQLSNFHSEFLINGRWQ